MNRPPARPLPSAVSQHHIAALERRAARHDGAVRKLLDERLRALRDAEGALAPPAQTAAAAAPSAPGGPLSALLAHMARQDVATDAGPEGPPATRELKAVRNYRSTWSRLSIEQRVNQALARVPHNAGPLNTQRLVHQALMALRDISPAYVHRLVSQVEALLWLERVGQAAPPAAPKRGAAGAPARRATGSSRS